MLFLVIMVLGSLMIVGEFDRSYVPIDDPVAAIGCFAAFLALVMIVTRLAQLRAVEHLDGTLTAIGDLQHIYSRSQRYVMLLAAACHFAMLFATRWPDVVWHYLGGRRFGLDEAVMAAPFLVVLAVGYARTWPIDRTIRRALTGELLYYFEPVQPVWSRWQYVSFQLRFHVLLVAVPLFLIIIARDAIEAHRPAVSALGARVLAPIGLAGLAELSPEVLLAAVAGTVILLAPFFVRVIWRCRPLPDGPLRHHLETIARAVGLRYRDLLLWPTHGVIINAAVVGLVGRVRYIMLSDGLIESMTDGQIEGVFGHEIGHVRRHHLPFFILFAFATFGLVTLAAWWVQVGLGLDARWVEAAMFGGVIVIWFFVFGGLSRAFERQADVFAVESLSRRIDESPDPCASEACPRHTPDGAIDAARLCRTAAEMVASALHRAAVLNAIPRDHKTWRHGSIAARCENIVALADHPDAAARFNRRIRRIKSAIVIAATAAVAWALASLNTLAALAEKGTL